MNHNNCWSSGLGRWRGTPVRMHMLLFLFIAVIFSVQWYYLGQQNDLLGTALVTTLVLLTSVVLHEMAHAYTLNSLGGQVSNIVLTPWGGNSNFELPDQPRDRLIVYLAGPVMSGLIFALGTLVLWQANPVTSTTDLINPFYPISFKTGSDWVISILKITTWVNFQIMVVNLLPCYPFDGQPILRSVLTWVSPDIPAVRKESTLMVFGHAIGLTMIGFAWFLKSEMNGMVIPPSVLFLLAGIAIIFAARYSYEKELATIDEDWDDFDDLNYESIYGDSAFFDLPESEESPYSQWLIEKQMEREHLEYEREQHEEGLVDEVLKKLHRKGITSLSPEERELLDRVSERIRRRRQQGV
ncbi:MAG: M50 family metallopeptidase [Mariniblastus sp.]|nr:M50 family metallopeptidase [Mariniblastus sp.]